MSAPVLPPARGLMDRNGQPSAPDHAPHMRSWVIVVAWRDLEPVDTTNICEDTAVLNWNARTITGATSYGPPFATALRAARAIGATVRLRIRTGCWAPEWAKTLDGPLMPWTNATDTAYGTTFTLTPWWEPGYLAAYTRLQRGLAAILDDDPTAGEIVCSFGSTVYSEPFIHQVNVPENRQALLDRGYTPEVDYAALCRGIDVHADTWAQTSTALALSAFEYPLPNGRAVYGDTEFPKTVANYLVDRVGDRAVLGNHAARDPEVGGASYRRKYVEDLYPFMADSPAGMYLQTDVPARVGTLRGTVDMALTFGTRSVELPQTYPDGDPLLGLTPGEMAAYAARFRVTP